MNALKTLAVVAAALLVIQGATAQTGTFTLISDPVDTRTDFVGIEVDGIEVSDCGSVANTCLGTDTAGAAIVSYDITNFVTGIKPSFAIRARTCIDGGICSAWTASVPFDFTAPGLPTGLRIVSG